MLVIYVKEILGYIITQPETKAYALMTCLHAFSRT